MPPASAYAAQVPQEVVIAPRNAPYASIDDTSRFGTGAEGVMHYLAGHQRAV